MTRPTTQAISPFFIVSNVDQTIAFYRDKLGFETKFRQPDRNPFFAIVGRDGAQIFVKSDKDTSPLPNPKRNQSMRWDAYVYAPDPDALAVEFAGHGAAFSVPLRDTHDGLRGFEICDPDGYVLFFGRPRSTPALIKGDRSMKESPASTVGTSVIVASEPQVFVSDLEAASAFYVHKLGFKVVLSYGEPPFYAQIARDGGRLNLRKVGGPVFDSGFRSREADALSATLTLDDAKPLFLEFQKAGVAFHQTLRTESWGARTFIVQDLDGNLIAFAGG
jgi:catechol 2,3-dioxygenase-like lactoylglutathione lyase family enzyme